MTTRNQVAITLAVGFVLIAAGLGGVLVQAPDEIVSANSITVAEELGLFREHTTVCQANERLPASTAALRISLTALHAGPAVSVTVSRGSQIVARGHRDAGWFSGSLTLPLQPRVARSVDAKICLTRGPPVAAPVEIAGNIAPTGLAATVNGKPLPGRMRIEYLTHGHRSWLSLAAHVARRLGLGHAPSGTWIVLPLAAMMAIAVALGAWLLIREQRYE
jgi:hypothetical protein